MKPRTPQPSVRLRPGLSALALFAVCALLATGGAYAQQAQQAEAIDPADLDRLGAAPAVRALSPEEQAAALSVDVPKSLTGASSPPPEIRYDEAKSVKIVRRAGGVVEEQPYVPIPILFRVNTDQFLDRVSKDNLEVVAEKLREIRRSHPGAVFSIEGHASAEGSVARNRELSQLRARRVEDLLKSLAGLSEDQLRAVGFGADFAEHPADAAESLRQKDRRVLVVRTK